MDEAVKVVYEDAVQSAYPKANNPQASTLHGVYAVDGRKYRVDVRIDHAYSTQCSATGALWTGSGWAPVVEARVDKTWAVDQARDLVVDRLRDVVDGAT